MNLVKELVILPTTPSKSRQMDLTLESVQCTIEKVATMDLMIKPLSITDVEEAAAMEDVAFSSINIQKEDVDAEVLARKEVVRGLLTNPSSTAIVIDVTYMVTESRIALNVRALDKIALTLFCNSTSFVLDSGRTSHMCASGSISQINARLSKVGTLYFMNALNKIGGH